MAFYGERLKYDYDPNKEYIYNLFVDYFENPKMTKKKDIGNYSMYICKINAVLGIEFRYIIIFVGKNLEKIGSERNLSELNWICLQTRTLEDEYNLQLHSYTPKRIFELDKKIHISSKDEKGYYYNIEDIPIKITLLPKNKGFDYSEHGTVISALETYQTILNFN